MGTERVFGAARQPVMRLRARWRFHADYPRIGKQKPVSGLLTARPEDCAQISSSHKSLPSGTRPVSLGAELAEFWPLPIPRGIISGKMKHTAVLLLSTPMRLARKGAVTAIAQFLTAHNGSLLHSDDHLDSGRDLFLSRLEWDLDGFDIPIPEFDRHFEPLAERFQINYHLALTDYRPKVAILVSAYCHCLADLLYRHHRRTSVRDHWDHQQSSDREAAGRLSSRPVSSADQPQRQV
jgi:hypothetical protein